MSINNQYNAMSIWYHGSPKKNSRCIKPLQNNSRETIVEYIKRIQDAKVK